MNRASDINNARASHIGRLMYKALQNVKQVKPVQASIYGVDPIGNINIRICTEDIDEDIKRELLVINKALEDINTPPRIGDDVFIENREFFRVVSYCIRDNYNDRHVSNIRIIYNTTVKKSSEPTTSDVRIDVSIGMDFRYFAKIAPKTYMDDVVVDDLNITKSSISFTLNNLSFIIFGIDRLNGTATATTTTDV